MHNRMLESCLTNQQRRQLELPHVSMQFPQSSPSLILHAEIERGASGRETACVEKSTHTESHRGSDVRKGASKTVMAASPPSSQDYRTPCQTLSDPCSMFLITMEHDPIDHSVERPWVCRLVSPPSNKYQSKPQCSNIFQDQAWQLLPKGKETQRSCLKVVRRRSAEPSPHCGEVSSAGLHPP